jgi:hypothetical protein
MEFRIKQTGKNTFIAQCRKSFLFKWGLIDNEANYSWSDIEKYSYCKTYDDAFRVIQRYKIHLEEVVKYPKYWKIK